MSMQPPSLYNLSNIYSVSTLCPALCHTKCGENAERNFFAIRRFLFLLGRDIIGLAETGSGKTGAFALPILNALLETPQRLFALVLTPTRELAFQISEQFEALGSSIGVQSGKCLNGRSLKSFLMT